MTTEEKARAYDEAVKKARCWLNDPQTIQDCNYTIEDAIQNIFPVLAKNEDEMIRKELINWINGKTTYEWSYEWCENKDRWIAYLEKLKEANKAIEAVERIDKYIDENVANAHDMKDSNPDKKYYRGWDDALGKMAGILQDVYSGEKQKEQKPDSLIYDKDLDKAAREFYLSGGADSPFDSTGLVPIVRMAEFGATWMKERMEKEQKPADYNEYKMLIEGARENGKIEGRKEVIDHPEEYGLTWQKPAKWSEADEEMLDAMIDIVSNSLYEPLCPREGMLAWLKNLPERFNLQPKPEWNEEDEEMIANIISSLHGYMCVISGNKNYNNHETYIQKEIEFLNALRPSWKPSKEQMKALKK